VLVGALINQADAPEVHSRRGIGRHINHPFRLSGARPANSLWQEQQQQQRKAIRRASERDSRNYVKRYLQERCRC
jgi:hypothetical protein